jgi:hypothetical protein
MPPPTFSPLVLCVLVLMLLASGMTFTLLTRRWTRDRPQAALFDWARERKFKIIPHHQLAIPAGLESLIPLHPVVEVLLVRGLEIVVKASTLDTEQKRRSWHLLLRTTTIARTPAALRPASADVSFIDLFTLPSYPAILTPDRFAVLATDSAAARAMTHCPARGLLPPDVGLLVHGPYVTIDFSARPFDPVEIDRMLVITAQIVPGLPAV